MLRIASCLIVSLLAAPCLWDTDTIDTELRGLPDALDLLVGRWHRHGDAYYRERIERLGKATALSLTDHDDLAVAYEKLGDQTAALAVMERKAQRLAVAPDADHEYRRLANVGTFHAHAGRYDEALVALRAAVALNPAAHFGREKYQIAVIEVVRQAQQRPALLSDASVLGQIEPEVDLGWHALFERDGGRQVPDDLYQGVAGMVRFGGRDSALLFGLLAEVFLARRDLNLAWWAMQRAIERGHPASEAMHKCLRSIESHWLDGIREVNSRVAVPTIELYREVRANADRWLAAFQRLEAEALARGEDVRSDDAVAALIAQADRLVPRPSLPISFGWWDLIWGLSFTLLVSAWLLSLAKRRRAARRHIA
jgi:hypothetical protein